MEPERKRSRVVRREAAGSGDNSSQAGYLDGQLLIAMPVMDDEDRPKKKLVHEIGQDLTLLSVKELDDRVMLLKEEIARLEADKVKKQAQRSAADQFFKR